MARGRPPGDNAVILLLVGGEHLHAPLQAQKRFAEVGGVEGVNFVVQARDFEFGAEIHLVVVAGLDPILRALAVLAHHDDRRLESRQHREEQVEQNIGIGIERPAPVSEDLRIEQNPAQQHRRKAQDERPRSPERGHLVGEPLPEGQPLLHAGRIFGLDHVHDSDQRQLLSFGAAAILVTDDTGQRRPSTMMLENWSNVSRGPVETPMPTANGRPGHDPISSTSYHCPFAACI
jgi:hypothetical protein